MLVDLVIPHKAIADSVNKDTATLNAKASAWAKIATAFNNDSDGKPVSADQLRILWRNLKDMAKSKLAKNSQSLKTTGGGPRENHLDEISEKVAAACVNEFAPMFNPNDSDARHHGDKLEGGGGDVVDGSDHEEPIGATPKASGNFMLSKRSRKRSFPTVKTDLHDGLLAMREKEHQTKLKYMTAEYEAAHYKKIYYLSKIKHHFGVHPPPPPPMWDPEVLEVTERIDSSVEEIVEPVGEESAAAIFLTITSGTSKTPTTPTIEDDLTAGLD